MANSTPNWPLPDNIRGLPPIHYGLHPPVAFREPGSRLLNSSDSTLARATPRAPGSQTPRSIESATSVDSQFHTSNVSLWGDVRQEEAKLRWDAEEELKRVSKELLRLQKWALITGLVVLNSALITISLLLPQAVYLFLALLSCNTILQAGMVICIVANVIWTKIICGCRKKRSTAPATRERMVLLLPCYNETKEEIARSLDSLIAQKGIDDHARLVFIVVDGNVRGPGMEKTTQDYFLEDILEPGSSKYFENGYRARDGLFMPVKTRVGRYKGIPFVFVGKRYNQGKRDSLCFARSFLYHFKKRSVNAVTIFNKELFEYLGNCLLESGLTDVDYLVGMDADTVFDDFCVVEMVNTIRKNPKLVGVCGHVCVDFDGNNFGLWSLYQSVEYSQTQGLRRMFQSRITGKVNCLPGCCQLIKVDEATFGDTVLRERFGYCPKPNDVMTQQIMGNYSEDSIHASIIFSLFPKKQTAQALRSKAFTIVPQTWKVFLSQRKRWALGSISNEFVMIFRPGIILVERLQSIVAVMTWAITPFIISAVAQLIALFAKKGAKVFEDEIFVGLISVLWVRYVSAFNHTA
ncbi:chitin synthase, partial [Metarhizium majus ARSEF 297]